MCPSRWTVVRDDDGQAARRPPAVDERGDRASCAEYGNRSRNAIPRKRSRWAMPGKYTSRPNQKRWDRAGAVHQNSVDHRVGLVHRLAREQVEQRAAQAVDVGPGVGVAGVRRLLGRHVVDRAHHLAALRQACPRWPACREFSSMPGQAHVEDLHRALRVQQQVRRLDVAVDHALVVGVLQAPGRLEDVVDGLGDTASGPARGPAPRDPCPRRTPSPGSARPRPRRRRRR